MRPAVERPRHRRAGVADRTLAAWAELARRLGTDPGDAARGLLGVRALLAVGSAESVDNAEGFDPDPDPNPNPTPDRWWVLATRLATPEAERVRARLDPAPRNAVEGVTVFTLDSGQTVAFLVPEGDGATLVVAPARAQARAVETVRSLRTGVDAFEPAPLPETSAERPRAIIAAAQADDAGVLAVVHPAPGGWRVRVSGQADVPDSGAPRVIAAGDLPGMGSSAVERVRWSVRTDGCTPTGLTRVVGEAEVVMGSPAARRGSVATSRRETPG